VISLRDALDIVDDNLSNLQRKSKKVNLQDSLGKISAKRVLCTIPLPRFNNSAMDGYGICGDKNTFKVVDKIFAGSKSDIILKDGEAVRIFTGAKVPKSVESVIPQEKVQVHDDDIEIDLPYKKGANIRYKGEDIDEDELILDQYEIINSSHIALLASQGIEYVEVLEDVKVAIFASGNELKLAGESLEEGQIYNSNAPYLMARSKELGCQCEFLGKCGDSVESLTKLISKALDYDLIITSGGVSVGDADFTKEAFTKLGMNTLFSKVGVKPGKPTTFGKIGDCMVLNLPGNPLACSLNFELFGKLIIKKLSKINTPYQNFILTKTDQDITAKAGVNTIVPGFFNGEYFKEFKNYSPASVNTLNHCNGMIVIDSQKKRLKKSDLVKFIPIRWDFLSKRRVDFIS